MSRISTKNVDKIYTNSVISLKRSPGSKLKYTWRRIYGDKIKMLCDNSNQYYCSPLDWQSLIEVEIENNGILIQKKTYGPVQKQTKLENGLKANNYEILVKMEQNYSIKGLVSIKTLGNYAFKINLKGQIMQFNHGLLNHRGWDFITPHRQSNMIALDTRIFHKQWQCFLEKVGLEQFASDQLTFIFADRISRDNFLLKLQEQSINFQNKIVREISSESQHVENNHTDGEENLFQNSNMDYLMSNKTIQDIIDVLYTPESSTVLPIKTNNIQQTQKSSRLISQNRNNGNEKCIRVQPQTIKNQQNQKQTKKKYFLPRTQSHCSLQKLNKNPEQEGFSDIVKYYLQNPKLIEALVIKSQILERENDRLRNNEQNQIQLLKATIKSLNERIQHLQKLQFSHKKLILNKSPSKDQKQKYIPEFLRKQKKKQRNEEELIQNLTQECKQQVKQKQGGPILEVPINLIRQSKSLHKKIFFTQPYHKYEKVIKQKTKQQFHKYDDSPLKKGISTQVLGRQ